MSKRRFPASAPKSDDLEAALATMSADDLRCRFPALRNELDRAMGPSACMHSGNVRLPSGAG